MGKITNSTTKSHHVQPKKEIKLAQAQINERQHEKTTHSSLFNPDLQKLRVCLVCIFIFYFHFLKTVFIFKRLILKTCLV